MLRKVLFVVCGLLFASSAHGQDTSARAFLSAAQTLSDETRTVMDSGCTLRADLMLVAFNVNVGNVVSILSVASAVCSYNSARALDEYDCPLRFHLHSLASSVATEVGYGNAYYELERIANDVCVYP